MQEYNHFIHFLESLLPSLRRSRSLVRGGRDRARLSPARDRDMTKRASASPARARIWDPRARFLEHAEASGVAVPDAEKRATSRTAARLAARREFELHKQVKRVRSELSRIFSGSRASTSSTHSKGAPLLVYERWLARSALAAEDTSSSSSPPLLPRGDPGGGAETRFDSTRRERR